MTMTAVEYRNLGLTEHRLQVLVLEHIRQCGKSGVFAMAMANEGKRSARTGQRMKEAGLVPGAPDLVVVLQQQRVAWLELKNGRGRQSIEQKGVQARLAHAGHVYGVARTLDEAITFLEEVGALR